MNWNWIVVSLIATLGLAGCASYKPSSAPVPAPTAEETFVSEGYAVAADAYVERDRQKNVFDADLRERGLLVIQMLVINKTDRPVLVRRTDMMLKLPDGSQITTLSAHSAAVQVGEGGSAVGATLAFGLIGALAASSAEDTARNARIADYQLKEFKDASLGKDETAHGFVFFMPPPGTKPFDQAELAVRFVDIESATSKTISIPLLGLGFPSTEKKD